MDGKETVLFGKNITTFKKAVSFTVSIKHHIVTKQNE
jgi:hypothetical protein